MESRSSRFDTSELPRTPPVPIIEREKLPEPAEGITRPLFPPGIDCSHLYPGHGAPREEKETEKEEVGDSVVRDSNVRVKAKKPPKILPHGILFSGHDNSTDKDIPSTISRKVETIDLAQEPGETIKIPQPTLSRPVSSSAY